MKIKPMTIAITAALASSSVIAQSTFFGLDSALAGWTISGGVASQNTTYSLPSLGDGYQISPAAGHYMAVLIPGGSASGVSGLATATGLSSSLINTVLTGSSSGGSNSYLKPTDFAYMSKDFSLVPGTTYKFSWAYASQDYSPYADGVFFSVSKDAAGQFTVLARTAHQGNPLDVAGSSTGFPAGTVVLESYGSTQWYSKTFTVSAAGTYKITFGSFNTDDTAVDPVFFISDISGNVIGVIVGGSVSVFNSATMMGNKPALPAAKVIDANPALLALFSGLAGDQEVSRAASQTLPVLTGASLVATNSALFGINRIVQARIANNLGMSSGENFYGDKHVWLKPFGSWADQDFQNHAAGYKADTLGFVAGIDGTMSPALRVGGAFAYAKSDINAQSVSAPQGVDIDMYQLIGYGSYSLDERTEINFQADIGMNKNKGQRRIAFTSTTASASYDSLTAHLGVGIGRNYPISAQTTVTPSVRADYTTIREEGYTESGAGLLNLKVGTRSADSLILGIDGKLAHTVDDQTTFLANLGIGYDALAKETAIVSAYAGAPGASFTTHGVDPSPWLLRGGVGAVYKTKTGVELTGRYDAEVREKFVNQTASIKFRWLF